MKRSAFRLGPSFLLALASAASIAAFAVACGDDAPSSPAPADAIAPDGAALDGGSDAAADADPPIVPKGSRVLGVTLDVTSMQFPRNVQLVRDAGAASSALGFAWDEIERPVDGGADEGGTEDGGASDTQIFQPAIHVVNLVLPAYGSAVVLTIDAMDVGGLRAPPSLRGLALDDPALATRYDKVTDYVLDQMRDTKLTALVIATSADVALGADASKHAAFAQLVTRIAAHAHAAKPGLQVGFDVTSRGLVAQRDLLSAAWAASDVVVVSYLPIDDAARVRPTSDVGADLDAVVTAAPADKPIVIRAAGYPESPLCGSDAAAQGAFVTAMFRAWDRHAARIPVVVFRELDDADEATASIAAARAGRSDAPFLAFLRSLGLRTEAAAPRPALDTLLREARARGF